MRSDLAFFSQSETKAAIDTIAALPELLLFAGAGVTITRTGLDWGKLLRELVPEEAQADPERLLNLYGPAQAASVVVEMYKAIYGHASGARLHNELRRLLYRNQEWLGGPLTGNLAWWLSLRDLAGRYTSVLTTNFDTHLEDMLVREGTLGSDRSAIPLEVRRWSRGADPNDILTGRSMLQEPSVVDFTYLHGFIADSQATGVRFADQPAGTNIRHLTPVLAEDEYARTSENTANILAHLLHELPVLILGSSMIDPPVLRALLDTRGSGHPRYAILPLQERAPHLMSPKDISDFKHYQGMRLKHFGVQPIFPDFYSQVAQFVQELALATCFEPGAYVEAGFPAAYSRRLDGWWAHWADDNLATAEDFRQQQREHHTLLADTVLQIRRQLNAQVAEHLKLEVWLRWRPSRTHRVLALWATSVGTLATEELMREGAVDTASEYASVQAFCQGRPVLKTEVKDGSRWQTYLSVPLHKSEVQADGLPTELTNVPVGVITLASMMHGRDSCLGGWNQAAQEDALKTMSEAGLLLS